MINLYQIVRVFCPIIFSALLFAVVPFSVLALTYSNSYDSGGNLTESRVSTNSTYSGRDSQGRDTFMDYGCSGSCSGYGDNISFRGGGGQGGGSGSSNYYPRSPTGSNGDGGSGGGACDGNECDAPVCVTSTCNTSATNYCKVAIRGTRSSCDFSGGFSVAPICRVTAPSAPADTTCVNYPLDQDTALVLDPTIVRTGNETTISWDLGDMNYPPACTLTGHGLDTFVFKPEDKTGSTVVTVTGPHQYTLTCGTSEVRKDIRVLPVLYES